MAKKERKSPSTKKKASGVKKPAGSRKSAPVAGKKAPQAPPVKKRSNFNTSIKSHKAIGIKAKADRLAQAGQKATGPTAAPKANSGAAVAKTPTGLKPLSPKKAQLPRQSTGAGAAEDAISAARSVAILASAAQPDEHGYVFINGRRVRTISTKGRPSPKRSKEKTAKGDQQPDEPKAIKTIKTRLTRQQLDEYQELLVAKRQQLVGDLSAMESSALQSSGGDLSHMPIHMADIGTDTFDQDFMLGMAAKDRELIREIDAALERIENATFGVCQQTGKVIPQARLKAKPWARYTIEAARKIEMGGGA